MRSKKSVGKPAGKSAPRSLPLARMADVVDAPGGNANNSMLPINKSRKGFLASRNSLQKGRK